MIVFYAYLFKEMFPPMALLNRFFKRGVGIMIPSASTVTILDPCVFLCVCPSLKILIKEYPGVRKQTDEKT